MSIQELQRKLAESKMDNVCKFVFNELATFVDWYAVSKEKLIIRPSCKLI